MSRFACAYLVPLDPEGQDPFKQNGSVVLVFSVQHNRSDGLANWLGQKYYPYDSACRVKVWIQPVWYPEGNQ